MALSKTPSLFNLGIRFQDGTLQTTAATTGPTTTPGGISGDIQFNNAGVFGGETRVSLAHGGTNADLSASGSSTAILAQDGSHVISARSLVAADLPNFSSLGCFLGGVGNLFIPANATTSTASPAGANNQVHVILFVLQYAITVNKLVYYVSTSNASDKWAYGIYSSDGNTKLIDSGVISPTSAGPFSITLGTPVTLPPGEYYFAETSSGTTAQSPFYVENTSYVIPMANLNRSRNALAANASVAGVLPATLGALNTGTNRSPLLVLFEN